MKIGFDVSQTGASRAGCGYFADSLIRALAGTETNHQFVLYPTFGDFFFDKNWERATYAPQLPNFARGLGHYDFDDLRAFWTTSPGDFEGQLGCPDVVHANNFFCPRTLTNSRLIYTLYDLSFLQNPEWTTEANRQGCFEGVFQASLHADAILAISTFTKEHFLSIFPHYPAERINVAPLASRFARSDSLHRPAKMARLQHRQFWLSVGTLEPRKNHSRLLHAYAMMKARLGRTWPLVFAGGKGWLLDHLNRQIGDLALGGDVIVLGYVDEAALQWLYQNCFACLYPSLFEGFGLPVLEAMSLGAPVISSNLTSIPEIVADAALLVDPYKEEAIFEAMVRLAKEPGLRGRLCEQGEKRARHFQWRATAEVALATYEQAILAPRVQETLSDLNQRGVNGLLPPGGKSRVECG